MKGCAKCGGEGSAGYWNHGQVIQIRCTECGAATKPFKVGRTTAKEAYLRANEAFDKALELWNDGIITL
jgi:hypothetical protein